jgi:hypothetical protein
MLIGLYNRQKEISHGSRPRQTLGAGDAPRPPPYCRHAADAARATAMEDRRVLGMTAEVPQETYRQPPPGLLTTRRGGDRAKGRCVSVTETVTGEPNETKKPAKILVGVAGFEPATPASRT